MHTASRGVSVVVCAKDESQRIEACLASLAGQGAHEVIVVDGCSTDGTAGIARRMGATVLVSGAGSLAADRQVGADFASGTLVAFIDADHRLPPYGLNALADELDRTGVDVLQARLSIVPRSRWNRAESDFLALTHTPGVRDMVGTAPAVFRAEVLQRVRFADTGGIDDTDWMYRAHRDIPGFVAAIGTTTVAQEHAPRFRDYLAKWRWYGAGDKAFMAAHPERAASMRFHLLIRYPLLHPARAIRAGLWRAAPFAFVQGLARFAATLRTST